MFLFRLSHLRVINALSLLIVLLVSSIKRRKYLFYHSVLSLVSPTPFPLFLLSICLLHLLGQYFFVFFCWFDFFDNFTTKRKMAKSYGAGRLSYKASSGGSFIDEFTSSGSTPISASPLSDSGLSGSLGGVQKNRGMMMNKVSTRFYGKSTTKEIKDDLLPAASKVANFSNRKMGDAGLNDICEILKMNRVTEMSLESNNLTEDGMTHLLRGLAQNNSLTSFDIAHNHIRDTGFNMIMQAFQNSNSLTSLNVSDNGITRLSGAPIAEALRIPTLQVMDLSNNIIYNEAAVFIAEALSDCGLTQLNLSCCRLGDKGVRSLIGAIKNCPTLFHLGLAENDITAEGVRKVLSGVLRSSVTHLDLALNPTGDEIAGDLIELLLSNQLLSLNIGAMDLGSNTIEGISANLGQLQTLILRSNDLDETAVETLMRAVRHSNTLTHLNLRSCLEGDVRVSIQHIADALEDSPLEVLELEVNGLDDECAATLAGGISKASKKRIQSSAGASAILPLRTLDLNFNNIGDEGLIELSAQFG
jgi:Ran GTPase-activating protein (RanGAP) involved in mRNA processing and transport